MNKIGEENLTSLNKSIVKTDFNFSFWHILGVNNKVYEFIDIFPHMSRKEFNLICKNMRHKEADEKSYERFLDSTLKDKNKIFEFKTNEILLFTKLLKSLMRTNQDYNFYSKQFFNLIISYHSFSKPSFSTHKMMNLFAFQFAYIIEYMRHHKLNVELLELSIKDKSIKPFLNECQKRTGSRTRSNLAYKMSLEHEKVKSIMLKNSIYLKSITDSTLKKYLSSWANRKSLPNLLHMYTITLTLHNNNNRQTEANLLQLILVRALLYIQNEYDISQQIEKEFIDKLRVFQKKIKILYKNDTSKILKLQNEYLRDYSLIFDIDSNVLSSIVGNSVTS